MQEGVGEAVQEGWDRLVKGVAAALGRCQTQKVCLTRAASDARCVSEPELHRGLQSTFGFSSHLQE